MSNESENTAVFDLENTVPAVEDKSDEIDSFTDHLIGDDKKFKDVESLAKGKYQSDLHIVRVEEENKRMREELNKRLTGEQILKQIREQDTKDSPASTSSTTPQGDLESSSEVESSKPSLDAEAVKELLNQELTQREELSQRAVNRSKFEQAAKEALGDDYKSKLSQKAIQLGLDDSKFLNDMAETKPDALINILQLNTQSNTQSNNLFAEVSVPARNTEAQIGTAPTAPNYSKFKKMQAENPTEFYSPRVQKQIYDLTVQHGEEWLDT